MDADIEFITNSNFKLKVVDVEIPDMPEDLKLDFYDESGGLSVPFIFHDVIVKWDDGSEPIAVVEEHINMFYIQGNENRNMPKWIMEQIERSSL